MTLGICIGLDRAREALDAGFDYVELPAVALRDRVEEFRAFRPPVTNLFFPGEVRLWSESPIDPRAYAREVIPLAAEVGVEIMVVGSGGARRSPDGANREAAFLDFAAELDEMARGYGIRICPESLNRQETNVGNDAYALATGLATRGVGYTSDSYHALVEWHAEGETGDVWPLAVPIKPSHVHLSNLHRSLPLPDDPEIRAFFDRLTDLGYEGRLSFEGTSERSLPELEQGLRALMA